MKTLKSNTKRLKFDLKLQNHHDVLQCVFNRAMLYGLPDGAQTFPLLNQLCLCIDPPLFKGLKII